MSGSAKKPGISKQPSQGDLKQKSLLGFFKAPAAGASGAAGASSSSSKPFKAPSQTPAKTPAKAPVNAKMPVRGTTSASSLASEADEVHDVDEDDLTPAKTPMRGSALGAPVRTPRTPSAASAVSAQDTPPTSDVDMRATSDAEEWTDVVSAKPTKRKAPVDLVDEEEEDDAPVRPTARAARNKKPRMQLPASDEDEDEDDASVKSASARLSRFRKSPVKNDKVGKARSRSRASEDDDFIVSDHDSGSPSPPPSASRGTSRRGSSASATDDGDASADDEPAPKKSSKAKSGGARPRGRPGARPLPSASAGGGSNSTFLTAAERRAQETKSDKKSAEDPFAFLQDIKDKDGKRPGQPGYDPRTLFIPPKAWKDFTPFEKQFWEIKQNHFDTVLFFQKGKFLELYEDDARIGHQEFDLKLTQRVKMSMVGVPESSFSMWASKFLAKGYKVGRVDQAETALGAEMRLAADKAGGKKKAPGAAKDNIVRRELNKVYTNGTLVDPELLTDEQAGHIVALREAPTDSRDGGRLGLCILDCATAEFNLAAFEDDACRTRLETAVRQLRVKELVFTKGNLSVGTTRLLKAILPSACLWTGLRDVEGFGFERTQKELNTMFAAADDMDEDDGGAAGAGIPEAIASMLGDKEAVEALGSMIWYLRTLNIDRDIISMRNFNIYDPMSKGEGLVLDGQTLAHIEVLVNSEGTEEGTLLKLLGRCSTPFGKRLFRLWLCMPLREVSAINDRLDAVQDLLANPSFEAEFAEVAKGLPDLERIVARIHANSCKVKDFLKVLKAFEKLSKGLVRMAKSADSFDSRMVAGLLRSAPDLMKNIQHVQSMYTNSDDPDELTPVDGKDKDYDDVVEEIAQLEETLEDELKKLVGKVGTKLEYWHSAQGTKEIYLVQVKATFKDVPKTWTKSGSTKAVTRWNVPALAPTIRTLKEARENRTTAIKNYKTRVFVEFDADRAVWLRAVRVLAELDCLLGLAKASAALGEPACRPELVDGDAALVEFEELRHPALSEKGDFIPNDIRLGGGVGRIALLTGPNMGGKSTAMRMTAGGVIMAQLGMLVPAKSARLCPVDKILTRMGAYDNMFSNASTFKVELDESCKILREATPKSLVILDELGRGTSTYDGMAIAGAVLHELATRTLALSFFATHYGSLTDDFGHMPSVRNMHMSTLVDDEKQELVFLYKLVDGVAAGSFGTHVARLAGVPELVVQRADGLSKDFARQFGARATGRRRTRVPIAAQADFAWLWRLAAGKDALPENDVRQREVLEGLRASMRALLIDRP